MKSIIYKYRWRILFLLLFVGIVGIRGYQYFYGCFSLPLFLLQSMLMLGVASILFLGGTKFMKLTGGLFFAGVSANALVVYINKGMPSPYLKTSFNPIYIQLDATTRWPFLADIYGGASIGDFLLLSSLCFFMFCVGTSFKQGKPLFPNLGDK